MTFTNDIQNKGRAMARKQAEEREAAEAEQAATLTTEQAKVFAQTGRNWLVENGVLPTSTPETLASWKFGQVFNAMTPREKTALKRAVVHPNTDSIEAVCKLCGTTLADVRAEQFNLADPQAARAKVGV